MIHGNLVTVKEVTVFCSEAAYVPPAIMQYSSHVLEIIARTGGPWGWPSEQGESKAKKRVQRL